MFVVSVKTGKKRMILVLAALLAVLTALLAAAKLLGTAHGADSLPAGETNGERLAFLAGYGWEAEEEPVELREVVIPDEFDDVYLRYNEVQKAQGMDLLPYAGKTCSQWIYNVTNYPSEEAVHASILVLDGKIIGGDLSSTEIDGSLCAFDGSAAELPWSVSSEPASSGASESSQAASDPAASAAESSSSAAGEEQPQSAASDAAASGSAAPAAAEAIPDDAWPID